MKFSEMPYTRPDTDKIRAQYDELISRFKNAGSADEQIKIMSELCAIISLRKQRSFP